MLDWLLHRLKDFQSFCLCGFQDTPEFDLVFDHTVDQWVAPSSADKCIFVQILYQACQSYWKRQEGSPAQAGPSVKGQETRQQIQVTPGPVDRAPPTVSTSQPAPVKACVSLPRTQFINCQSKLTRGKQPLSLELCSRSRGQRSVVVPLLPLQVAAPWTWPSTAARL